MQRDRKEKGFQLPRKQRYEELEQRVKELEAKSHECKRAEEMLRGSQNRLSMLMERIINSDYISMEHLVEDSPSYPIDEVRAFLERIIEAWKANELIPAAVYALLKFIHMYLNQPKIEISFKNRNPIPICYFSGFLIPSASLLHSYLKSLSFAVTLFQLNETNRHLKEFIEKKKPPAVLFTLSQFLHVDPLKQLLPYLHERNLNILVGGIPFERDESLKQEFSACIFPRDLAELTMLLENLIEEKSR